MTVTAFKRESLLILYRNSYTVQLFPCFYDIAIPRYNVCDSVSIQAVLPLIFEGLSKFIQLIYFTVHTMQYIISYRFLALCCPAVLAWLSAR